MLIIALVLALIGLASLVFAVVTNNELVAWVCIGASALGVVLLIVDAVRERQGGKGAGDASGDDKSDALETLGNESETEADAVDYPADTAEDTEPVADRPEEGEPEEEAKPEEDKNKEPEEDKADESA